MNRSKDWLAQAERDLLQAQSSLKEGFYEWACFIAQQAAEMGVKGLCEDLRREGWGHSIKKIMGSLSDVVKIPEDILEKAGTLDRYYIPTRYPNGFERGAPRDYFFRKDAEEAIHYANEIINFCKGKIPG